MSVAYSCALVKPMRKLLYNLTIILFSILVAVIIGALEALRHGPPVGRSAYF